MYYLETKRLLAIDASEKKRERQQRVLKLTLLNMFALFSTQNVLAPNLTAIAQSFSFSDLQRDEYIGGQLTMVFFLSGLAAGVTFGLVSAVCPRSPCLIGLTAMTGVGCLAGSHLHSYSGLVGLRLVCGWGVGGSLPLMYSMLGDLIPAKERTLGSAYVTTVCGFGVFFGQMVGAMGGGDWHTPFVVLGVVCLGCAGLAYHYGHEPERGANDPVSQQHQQLGEAYQPVTSFKHIRKTVLSPTNLVIWSQAFPGNIPWGIALVFLNDFMCQDLELSMTAALLSINVLAFLSLLGNLTGGLLGRYLHTQPKWLTPLTASVCCVIRSSPLWMVFGWRRQLGVPDTLAKYALFTATLGFAGFVASMPGALLGGMMLNVNLPTTRGIVFATYAALEDFSKATGAIVVALLVPVVGTRDVAYQVCLLLWLIPGLLLLFACHSVEADEQAMEEAVLESINEGLVRGSKQRARKEVRSVLSGLQVGEATLRVKTGKEDIESI
jgi:MFS family permease